MKFCFDNNLPPALASAMHHLSQQESLPVQVIHLRERFARDAQDTDWVGQLGAEGDWTVISQDAFRKSNAEREMMRSAGVSIYVLEPQWADQPYWKKAERLVHWWPLILQHSSLTRQFAVRVPWRSTGQSRFQQIRI